MKRSNWLVNGVKHLTVLILLFCTLFPIIYLFLTSVKPAGLLLEIPPRFIFKPNFSEYVKIFRFNSVLLYITNSLVVTAVSTIGALILGTMASFAFVYYKFVGKKTLLFIILLTRMFPPVTTLIPVYLLISKVGLSDTRTGLILPYISFQIPLVIWIMNDFIRKVPKALFESAKLDGCTTGKLFIQMVLPLTTGGLVASGILAFIYNWNEMLFALTLTSFNAKTLPVILKAFTESEGIIQWGSVASIGMITLLPILFFFIGLNKFLIKGMMAGAVKG